MPSDALIHAADNLTTAIAGVIPPPNMTTNTIEELIKIFKTQAEKEKDEATLQRVLQENAQAERVLNKNMAPSTRPTNEPLARPTSPQATLFPPLEIKEYPDVDSVTLRGIPISNQDDNSNSARPATNTRYQCKVCTITQDYLFHLMDSPFLPQQFTSKQASACKYLL
jgi:hypothetical protein